MGLFDKILGGKSFEDKEQENKDAELAAWVKGKLEEIRASSIRVAHESTWMQNCAYTVGFNGLYFNAVTRSYQPINRTGGGLRRNRSNVNKILPTLQNRLSRLCKSQPKYDVRPNDNTQEAKDNARFKLDVLTSMWDNLRLPQKRIPLFMWVQECSHGYLGVFWDDSLGNLVQDPLSGEEIFEGDIRVEVVSPFEVFPDPQARDMESAQYFIRAKVRPLMYFVNHYGEKGKEVKEEDVWLLSAQYENRIATMNNRGPSGAQQSMKNCAIEMTYYEKRSKLHPRGRMIVVANGVKLHDGELPCGRIPLVKFDDIPVAGKFYPEAVTTHLIAMQDRYNEITRRKDDIVKKHLAGKLISPRGNNLSKEAITDESGEVVQYDVVPQAPDGGRPMPMPMPTIPNFAFTEQDKIDGEFNEVSGISEVSKGSLPSASIPAIGMQLLVEQDDTRIGIMTEQHELAWAEVGTLILDYIQKYYKTPRKLKFAGKNSYVIEDIVGEKLEGDNDVIVVRGSTVPGSKTLRRQDILNAYNQGLLGDPADPKVRQNVLAQLEYGDVAEIYLDYSLDMKKIKREIEFIEQGIPPEIHEADNHVLAYQELNRYRKSEKFDQMPDDIKNLFMAVMEEHLRFQGVLSGAIPEDATPEEMAAAEAQASQQTAEMMPQINAEQQAQDMQLQDQQMIEPQMGGGMI